MNFFLIILAIFVISFILALISMKDLGFGEEVRKFLKRRKIRGTIIFFKDKINHYSSKKSSYSSNSSSNSSS